MVSPLPSLPSYISSPRTSLNQPYLPLLLLVLVSASQRHALLRLWHLNGVEVHWYTPEGHPAIFDITKKRFHNVLQVSRLPETTNEEGTTELTSTRLRSFVRLQGVNPPGIELHDRDKEMFEKWTQG